MASRRAQPIEQAGVSRVVKPVLISVALGALICIGILLLLSAVLSSQNIPQSVVGPMATTAITIGGLAAGFSCAKMMRQKGLLYGAICGAVLSLVVLMASFSLPGNDLGMTAIFKIVFMLLGGMLGGVMGVNTRQKRRR